jgi:hypothetical protein
LRDDLDEMDLDDDDSNDKIRARYDEAVKEGEKMLKKFKKKREQLEKEEDANMLS